MSKSTSTFEEMFESLTGFEEIGVEDRLGMPLTKAAEDYPIRLTRALVAVELMRAGASKADAWKQAMTPTLGEIQNWFSTDDDVMPDEPDSESGKDGSSLG